MAGFAQEAAVARSIASFDITYGGHHEDIVRAHCRGLRRYGVHRYGSLDFYHRLNCDLTGADGNVYAAQVVITRSSSASFSWQIVTGTRRSQPGG